MILYVIYNGQNKIPPGPRRCDQSADYAPPVAVPCVRLISEAKFAQARQDAGLVVAVSGAACGVGGARRSDERRLGIASMRVHC